MTNEEAKERLKKFQPFLDGDDWKECYQLAIDALDKQIQKKPIEGEDEYGYFCHLCPNCGSYKTWDCEDWCSECGQHFDWSEE